MKNSNTPRRWSKVPSLSNNLEKSDAGPLSCYRMQRVFFFNRWRSRRADQCETFFFGVSSKMR